jgi:pyruvyltransferase
MDNLVDRLYLAPHWARAGIAARRNPAPEGPVTWKASGGKESLVSASWASTWLKPNLGDQLAPSLLRQVLGFSPVQVPLGTPRKILSVGSVVEFALAGDFVWGSGSLSNKTVSAKGAKFFAVRGPRTRELVRDAEVPSEYGDPASLLPLFLAPSPNRSSSICLVPHYVDKEKFNNALGRESNTVNVRSRNLVQSVERISSAEVVISSSLHGLIIAEAYGVPTVWIEPSEGILGGRHKFLDYFEGAGRSATPYPLSLGLNGLIAKAQQAHPPATNALLQSAWAMREEIIKLGR